MPNNQALQYRSLELETKVANASPHELIQMLFEGAIERLLQAKACAERGDISAKGAFLSKALGIVGGLRESLNMEMESDIPQNLDRLYEYIQLRLIRGNLDEDNSAFSECIELIKTIKSGWEGIADQV
ncbi:MAG: flagellar export chaperone FliS [Candidatus Pelagadaptatus aseana]|uniref:flagellar export chaperone FliS n=1 Tax=Candidatus Pelagadaptatus aseana TaxID=3120508 RepID=UPI0039B3261C